MKPHKTTRSRLLMISESAKHTSLCLAIFMVILQSMDVQAQTADTKYVRDSSGSYDTVRIGEQTWMAFNLDIGVYRNGDSIPRVADFRSWVSLNTGAWCHYGNDSFNARTYARLYNWEAVNDPRGLCPVGWHVSSSKEWTVLAEKLGGMEIAGGALKSRNGWAQPNTGANNGSAFNAQAGGYRYENGFSYAGESGFWWCRDEEDATTAYNVVLTHREASIYLISSDKSMGLSVRCVKDK
jgi:uncharacterized protein (TIGR02145 family)